MKKLGKYEFAKYHGLGNDYIVVDPRQFGIRLTPGKIREICHRNMGVGSDGILALTASRRCEFGVRIYNPDGSEAEKSGNGLRIYARFLYDFGYTRKRAFSIETRGGMVHSEIFMKRGQVDQIRVEMGQATFLSSRIPVRGKKREVVGEILKAGSKQYQVTCVSVGNPHCVILTNKLNGSELRTFGPLIENHRNFPNRINVQFAKVRSRRHVDALIWERGAGETMASGSSSCAVAAAAFKNGLVGRNVVIHMEGGDLAIEINKDYYLSMTGPATPICRGKIL